MANGNEPSAIGLIILTGMTIAAVVGLYAYDAIPRRDGVAPSTQIAWPRWQSNDAAPAPVQQSPQQAPAPAYSQQPAYAQPNDQRQQQQPYPQQEQGYGPPNQPPQQYPQDTRGQDVPSDQQDSQGGAGQPPPPNGSQGQ
jgi:hypothetical protein